MESKNMAVISGVLKGPMGDARVGVVIELRAVRTSATVVIQARSQSVTDATGRYALSVEPGQYDVMITAAGRQPERVGGIQVMVNSATGTLNDFLTIPGETDLNPAIVATVDQMRADAAASAAAAKVSETNAAAAMTNALSKTVITDQTVAGMVTFNKGSVSLGAVDSKASSPTNNPAMRFMTDANVEKVAIIAEQDPVGIQIRWAGKSQSALFYNDGTVRFPGAVQSGTTPLLKAGEFGVGGSALPFSGNIDELTLASGFYYALPVSTGTKPPGSPGGHLTISREGITGTTVSQKWTPNNDDTLYVRRFYPGGWSTWKKVWSEGSLPNPLKVGDYGLGNPYTPTITDLAAQLTNQWWHTSGIATAPNTGLWAGISGGYDAVSRWNMAFLQGGTTVDFRVQVVKSGTAGAWATVWHTLNTTVDANGFIKKASPIVKLFGTGESELNDQSQGVTTERVSEGVYRISGTLGFNADAEWGGVDGGIEIPTDRNKLPLVWVDYEVDATGDLLIKTFHRVNSSAPKFAQNVKVGYKEGQPIDIPAGRWIDLRVEMPGGDEPEYVPEPEQEDDVMLEPEQPDVTEPEGGEEPALGESEATEEPQE
ncbi:MAG: prophage tail fiber N-terminal domain-containing protein [Serratia sp. (in: enterobacteria)]|uniref:phage tail fiber protein n=1 Tax=Serratia sp. (in: enterobacteria) TaxID=616 RepID=UPI003F3D35C6